MLTAVVFLLLPFLIFWILLFLGREELGIKWILVLIGISVALTAGFLGTELPPFAFVGPQVLIDIILVIVLFGGNI